MQKQVRILTVSFGEQIQAWEIPAFRAAIAKKVGFEHDLFHNHTPDAGHIFRYPLIQYKTIAGHPAILCIERGVDEIYHFFQRRSWDVELSGRALKMEVKNLNLNEFTLQLSEHEYAYRIGRWVGLNSDNYRKYHQLERATDRIALLESLLRANILSFA